MPALVASLEDARRRGLPVVYVVDEHEPEESDLHALAGSPQHPGHFGRGVIWPPLAPRSPRTRVVRKPRPTAPSRARPSPACSRSSTWTRSLLAGCLTEVGIFATATDALQRGYVVEVPPETQAGAAEAHEKVTLGVPGALVP